MAKENQKLLAQVLRTMLPDELADPELTRGVQRSPGHAQQTATAYAAPDDMAHDAGHISYSQGRIPERQIFDLPESHYDIPAPIPHGVHDPNAQVLPEGGGPEYSENTVGDEMVQKLPPVVIHPSTLQWLLGSMSGRSSDPSVHQAGEE